MLRLLGLPPRATFEHVSLLSLFYKGTIRHNAAFLYNFTKTGRWKRITVFSFFYGPRDGRDYFTVEITTKDTTPEAQAMLRADFERHARELNLCDALEYVDCAITERAYPLFRRGKTQELQGERDRLAASGVDCLGRQGSFSYLSAHSAAQEASRLASQITLRESTA